MFRALKNENPNSEYQNHLISQISPSFSDTEKARNFT
jgi:hypothetical protein